MSAAVQCPNCGKTDRVTIGNRQYCANCGTVVSNNAPSAPAAPVAGKPQMTDIRQPQAGGAVVAATTPLSPPALIIPSAPADDKAEPTAAVAAAVTAPPATAPEPAVAPVAVNPAGQFHQPPATGQLPKPRPVKTTPAATVTAVASPQKTTPAIVASAATSAPVVDASRQADRLVKAQAVNRSDAIQKFTAPPVIADLQPSPAPARPAVPTLESAISRPAEPAPELPNAAVTAIDSLQKFVPSPAPAAAAVVGPKPSTVAAAAVALAIMGGYIWIHNYPNMALKLASSKAGFEASLPSYVPPSYSFAGPVAFASGEITLHFNSPSEGGLTLSQRKTSWDPGSLLQNYITQKTDKYLAVQDKGLTVYLYNGGQASWINRGVWYTLEGSNRLNRDQILKIVDSL